MKVQDIAFVLILVGVILFRKPRIGVMIGLVSIVLAMPLFFMKTGLFTAQRLVMYATGLFIFATIYQLRFLHRKS